LADLFIQMTTGTTPGPFDIYTDTTGLLESNVSSTRLKAAIVYDLAQYPSSFTVVNKNPACNGYSVTVSVPVPTQTQTQTPTVTPTQTLTPTITATSTPNPSPTLTPTLTVTKTVTPTVTATITAVPTQTPTAATLLPIVINVSTIGGMDGYANLKAYRSVISGSDELVTSDSVSLFSPRPLQIFVPLGQVTYFTVYFTESSEKNEA
jgi:hypothetical protein